MYIYIIFCHIKNKEKKIKTKKILRPPTLIRSKYLVHPIFPKAH